ncbi:MAG TPA: DUF3788 domain-containing protein [Candidatus Solibacter sp.]|jgi:hypothetical protein
MLPNAFIGRTKAPTDEELSAELGDARALWDQLLKDLALPVQEWHSYSAKAGWSLRLKAGKRTIVYVTPCRGAIRVSFALGEKAMKSARESKLPASAIKILDEAPRYAEGAGVRLDVTTKRDLATVKKLAAAKMAN